MLDFMIIGGRRCGTSWTHWYLSQHPEVHMSYKELHFWNQDVLDINWYNSLFQNKQGVAGEATPAYGRLNLNLIQRVYQYNPNMKLIFIIRNLIDAYWTDFQKYSSLETSLENVVFWKNQHTPKEVYDYQNQLMNWMQIFPKEQFCILQFSEILNEPKKFLQKILDFLGISNTFPDDLNFEIVGSLVSQKVGLKITCQCKN